MRVKMGITALFTDRDALGRLLRAGVVVVGLAAGFLVLTLLTAGKADAAERSPDSGPGKGDTRPGLLGTVTHSVVGEVVGEVVEPVAPVLRGVADTVAPVVNTVTAVAEPVVTPVVQGVAKLAEPVTTFVRPVVEPVLTTVSDVAEPVTRTVVEPLLTPRAKAPEPAVSPPSSVRSEQDSWVPPTVAVEAGQVTDPRSGVTKAVPSRQVPSGTAFNVFHSTVPSSTGSGRTVSDVPGPDVPWSPPTGPALTGATGGAATANHGPGVDGSVVAGGVAPRHGGEWLTPPGTFLGPSWWISYGRSHPS